MTVTAVYKEYLTVCGYSIHKPSTIYSHIHVQTCRHDVCAKDIKISLSFIFRQFIQPVLPSLLKLPFLGRILDTSRLFVAVCKKKKNIKHLVWPACQNSNQHKNTDSTMLHVLTAELLFFCQWKCRKNSTLPVLSHISNKHSCENAAKETAESDHPSAPRVHDIKLEFFKLFLMTWQDCPQLLLKLF